MSDRRKELDACLKPEHLKAGYYLNEDEDFLYLKREGKMLAVWNAGRATVAAIQEEIDRLMARLMAESEK
jgi:hypothetical protein